MKFGNCEVWRLLEGGAYFKVREMDYIKKMSKPCKKPCKMSKP